jgi:hypothetical protein
LTQVNWRVVGGVWLQELVGSKCVVNLDDEIQGSWPGLAVRDKTQEQRSNTGGCFGECKNGTKFACGYVAHFFFSHAVLSEMTPNRAYRLSIVLFNVPRAHPFNFPLPTPTGSLATNLL